MSDTIIEVVAPTRKPRTPIKRAKRILGTTAKPKARVKAKKWKFKKSILTTADSRFSEKIRARDGYCQFPYCGRTDQLTCSHYIGRAKWPTRFDEENCITLCRTHHYWDKDIGWEFQKQRKGEKGCDWDGRYTLFMKKWLGEDGFNALMERSKLSTSRATAIKTFLGIDVELE